MTRPADDVLIQVPSLGTLNTNSFCSSCDYDHHNEDPTVQIRRRKYRDPSHSGRSPGTSWKNPTAYQAYGSTSNPQPQGTRVHGIRCAPGDPCDARYIVVDGGYGIDASISTLPDTPSWMRDKAVSRALNQLKGNGTNLAVAFAERKETAELFAHTVKRIASGVRAYRNRKKSSFWQQILKEGTKDQKGRWQSIPNDWLELQYGWNPLMQDIDGACSALSRRDTDPGRYRVVVTSQVKETQVHTWSKSDSIIGGDFTIKDTYDFTVKCKMWYVLRNPLLAAFSSLGLTNPAEVVWERVKYSFVVDWFLPVGNWLSTLDADFGWDFWSGAITHFTKTTGRGGELPPPDDSSNFYIVGTDNYYYDGWYLLREFLTSSPGAGLPHFKNPFSSKHVANALSLLVQAFH